MARLPRGWGRSQTLYNPRRADPLPRTAASSMLGAAASLAIAQEIEEIIRLGLLHEFVRGDEESVV
eukprot:157757-Hanusia_phi.AAC.1